MTVGTLFWLASLLPQAHADPVCLTATIYLEARNQSELGQHAVAEVALRRLESGRWGDSLCEVVTARAQFAPTIVRPGYRIKNLRAWNRSAHVALSKMRTWTSGARREVVPGADHFANVGKLIAVPAWAQREPVAVIGDHNFYSSAKF